MSTVSVLCAGGVDPTAFVGDVHYVGVLDPGFWMLPLENVAVRLMLPPCERGTVTCTGAGTWQRRARVWYVAERACGCG